MRCFGKTIWLSGDMKALNNVTNNATLNVLVIFKSFAITFYMPSTYSDD